MERREAGVVVGIGLGCRLRNLRLLFHMGVLSSLHMGVLSSLHVGVPSSRRQSLLSQGMDWLEEFGEAHSKC